MPTYKYFCQGWYNTFEIKAFLPEKENVLKPVMVMGGSKSFGVSFGLMSGCRLNAGSGCF